MISCKPAPKPFWDNAVDAYIFFVSSTLSGTADKELFNTINTHATPSILDTCKDAQFKGDKDQCITISALYNGKPVQYILVGLGDTSTTKNRHAIREQLRRGLCSAINILKKRTIPTAVVSFPCASIFGVEENELIKQMSIAAIMSDYEFSTFLNDKKNKRWNGTLLFAFDTSDQDLNKAFEKGIVIGNATSLAREMDDLPGNIMTPLEVAAQAKKIAEAHNLSYTSLNRQNAQDLGMGGFCAVDEGSEKEGCIVILEYKPQKTNAPTICLVGKGITFDTGGVSLKPSQHMDGMKFDMSGAGAVIATMNIIGALKPNVHVIAIAPIAENMPSGKAARQDDIVTFMNGKTAVIRSTDAEGRLILADALCYAEKYYNPDIIIDIATLTGACAYSLGHFYTGLMTPDDELATQLHTLGLLTGDKVWRLPMDDDFKAAIKSDVADIANTGSSAYLAGTVTASHFLSNFVEKARWAHLDIAGTAHEVPGINYLGKGATGAGIRLMTEFILSFNA